MPEIVGVPLRPLGTSRTRITRPGKPRTPARFPILHLGLALAAVGLLRPVDVRAQTPLSEEHRRIDFLIGEWRTSSELPNGTVREGDLRYRWVLGGAWMQVTFFGDVPAGTIWEAHVMQRWNPDEGAYESLAFQADGSILRYRGSSEGPGHYRIETMSESGVTSGIDYHATDGGAVYQENWAVRDGERQVTLRTTYRAAGG